MSDTKIDLDDLQQLRHGAAVVGEYIAVYYRTLRASGVPRKLARKLTFDQWIQVRTSDQTEAMSKISDMMLKFMEGMGDDRSSDD